MLYYENGRFQYEGISFQLPNGVAIDTSDSELCLDGFCLRAPNGGFSLLLHFFHSMHTTYDELTHIFKIDEISSSIETIEPISIGALNGYRIQYETENTHIEEYTFDVPHQSGYICADICLTADKDSAPHDRQNQERILNELLSSIQLIDTTEDIDS